VFDIGHDDVAKLTTSFYVMMAEEGRRLRAFLLEEGEEKGGGVSVYSGALPPIPYVSYPAWYKLDSALLVLKQEVGDNYVVSVRDSSGGVVQETLVVEDGSGFPVSIKKSIYLPCSTKLYNRAQVRRVGRDASVEDIPSFAHVAAVPVQAEFVTDARHRNIMVPVAVAIGGDDKIREHCGIDKRGKPMPKRQPMARTNDGRVVPASIVAVTSAPVPGVGYSAVLVASVCALAMLGILILVLRRRSAARGANRARA
jgi:hypothetical protein